MIMESLNEYLDTLAGYIFDDDKLVTYKWLSKVLEVHVNIAKQILWEFWQRHKDEKSFECTFLLMGVLQDDGVRVEVVREKDLCAAKEKYNKVISEHVYSLQKILSEIQLLGCAESGDIKYAAIKCLENNERCDAEVCTSHGDVLPIEIQSSHQEKAELISELKKEMRSEKKPGNKKESADRKGFNHLFGKIGSVQQSSSGSHSTSEIEVDSFNSIKQTSKDVPEPSIKPVQTGALNSFFQRGKNQSVNNKSIDSPEGEESTGTVAKENTVKQIISEKTSKQKNVRGQKRNRSKDSNSTAKRRKRITMQSDSSEAESSEIEEIPPTPEKASSVKTRSLSPPQVKFENGKRKVLKIVDKTYEEDGYLVTKKVHVYESCSDEESEMLEPKKALTVESQLNLKGKKNIKQTTLMNFFKKS